MRRGFIRLQATFRARKVLKWYLRTRRRIVIFQRRCKGWVVRKNCREQLRAVIRIQALFRMILAFKIAKKKRIEVGLVGGMAEEVIGWVLRRKNAEKKPRGFAEKKRRD
jgi:myosin-7